MQAKATEPPPVNTSVDKKPGPVTQINTGEIADKVYRLMQHDLLVERERTTGLRG